MILLTGATGFIGSALLAELLQKYPRVPIAVLIRDRSGWSAERRFKILCSRVSERCHDAAARLHLIRGDLLLPNFGMGLARYTVLASSINAIYHCAGSVDLAAPLQDARRQNIALTESLLEFAANTKRITRSSLPFYFVSTALVAGGGTGLVTPDYLNLNARFRNNFERAKAEAEALIRGAPHIRAVIFRPSIVVGESESCAVSRFNTIYLLPRLWAEGKLQYIPGDADTPLDIVPVDFVARAITVLSRRREEEPSSFHITAGAGRESSPRELFAMLKRAIGVRPASISAGGWSRPVIHRRAAFLGDEERRLLAPWLGYFSENPRFVSSSSVKALGWEAPRYKEYAHQQLHYCVATNWGRGTEKYPGSAAEGRAEAIAS